MQYYGSLVFYSIAISVSGSQSLLIKKIIYIYIYLTFVNLCYASDDYIQGVKFKGEGL